MTGDRTYNQPWLFPVGGLYNQPRLFLAVGGLYNQCQLLLAVGGLYSQLWNQPWLLLAVGGSLGNQYVK